MYFIMNNLLDIRLRYKRSLYYIGSYLWDALPAYDIYLPDIFTFKQRLRHTNKVYRFICTTSTSHRIC